MKESVRAQWRGGKGPSKDLNSVKLSDSISKNLLEHLAPSRTHFLLGCQTNNNHQHNAEWRNKTNNHYHQWYKQQCLLVRVETILCSSDLHEPSWYREFGLFLCMVRGQGDHDVSPRPFISDTSSMHNRESSMKTFWVELNKAKLHDLWQKKKKKPEKPTDKN